MDGSKMAGPEEGIGRRVGGAIGGALDTVLHRVGSATHLIGEVFRLPIAGQGAVLRRTPGAAPGIEFDPRVHVRPEPGQVTIDCIDYGPSQFTDRTVELQDLAQLPREPWVAVRWVRVAGLHPYAVDRMRQIFGFHTLAAEDVLHVPQRARAQTYDEEGHLFVVTQMLMVKQGQLASQQVSIFVQPDLVVSFQEYTEDIWSPLSQRLSRAQSRLREGDGGYLAYAILDVIVDHCYPVLQEYATQLEGLEERVLDSRGSAVLQELHNVRRELALIRRLLWPTRELLSDLRREDQRYIQASTRAYLSDVQDHCIQLTDMVETFRDLSTNLTDLYLSLSSYRMSEVMQYLTVISVVFIPLTFLAGLYGMNFDYLPGRSAPLGFYGFLVACLLLGAGLAWFFRRKRWIPR